MTLAPLPGWSPAMVWSIDHNVIVIRYNATTPKPDPQRPGQWLHWEGIIPGENSQGQFVALLSRATLDEVQRDTALHALSLLTAEQFGHTLGRTRKWWRFW